MSDLPDDAFLPANAKLGQAIYENPAEGVAPELRFFIEIAMQPFEFDDETLSPLLRIDNIVVPAKSWKSLAESACEFPYAPKPGSVEAAVLLFGEHNPADVTKIEFGPTGERSIGIRFSTEVDFEIEADRDDLEQVEMSFDLVAAVEPLRISTSLEKRCGGDPEMIVEAVREFVDLADYGEIEKVPGGFAFGIV